LAEVLAERRMAAKTVAATMMTSITQALADAQLQLADVEAIATASGPGSFTGVRIGLATAKGLAQGAGLPVRMVSSLALLAMRLPQARAVLDAGRGEFYVGDYCEHGRNLQWERLMTRAELLAVPLAEGCSYVACEQDVADDLCAAGLTVLLGAEPDAATVARFVAAGGLAATQGWETADGNYLRRSDAEVKLQASR
jgi:tRNA threonylcarbamoyl adenosine modification protein YeaZ